MRKDFYRSKVWIKNRKAYAISKYCICEKCGRAVYVDGVSKYLPKERRLRYIVHHKIPLNETNYKDINISLNWDNLQLLCIDCHNKIDSNSPTRERLGFDSLGNLIQK